MEGQTLTRCNSGGERHHDVGQAISPDVIQRVGRFVQKVTGRQGTFGISVQVDPGGR